MKPGRTYRDRRDQHADQPGQRDARRRRAARCAPAGCRPGARRSGLPRSRAVAGSCARRPGRRARSARRDAIIRRVCPTSRSPHDQRAAGGGLRASLGPEEQQPEAGEQEVQRERDDQRTSTGIGDGWNTMRASNGAIGTASSTDARPAAARRPPRRRDQAGHRAGSRPQAAIAPGMARSPRARGCDSTVVASTASAGTSRWSAACRRSRPPPATAENAAMSPNGTKTRVTENTSTRPSPAGR